MKTRTRISKTRLTPAGEHDREAAWAQRTARLDARVSRKDRMAPAAIADWEAKAAKATGRRPR